MSAAKGPSVNIGIKRRWANRMETEMPYNHGEPVPPEIPKEQRKLYAALRSYRRRRYGCELTVEDFEARRRWKPVGQRKTKVDRPQTAEGVAKILREKGLDRVNQGMPAIEQMEAWVRGVVDRHGDDGDRFALSGILEDRDRLRSQLASLIDLIRRRYPRLLERGNPLYDGVLARAVDAQAAAKPMAVMEPIGCGPCARQWECESQENASPCSDFLPLDRVAELLMCPCCGGRPKFHKIPDDGEYIECSNAMCRLTTPLISAVMEPARPLLAEIWNRRPVAQAAAQTRSVAVSEEELVALRCLDDAVTINGDGMSTDALGVDWELARSAKRRLSDIRAAKGGAT